MAKKESMVMAGEESVVMVGEESVVKKLGSVDMRQLLSVTGHCEESCAGVPTCG